MGESAYSSRENMSLETDDIETKTVDVEDVDVAAQLATGSEESLDPKEALRIRRRIDIHILPLMCLLYLMQFADKTTLGQSAVLGLEEDAHLSADQFNWLGTIFYLAYLGFEYPQNLALQKFPIGKWMSINIFIWSVALCAHAACKNFGGLFAVRFILGVCEGAITPGFLIVTAMFYTRAEQTARVGYWFLMNGFAVIALGFISFGVVHITYSSFHPWQWLMIITGVITLITSVLFWFFFPDSPANAWFLSPEDRRLAIIRIKVNQAGIENKRFKWSQCKEAVSDPKTWLLALIVALCQVPNSLTNQRQIIVNEFGFNLIQTTLLGCVDGVVEIVTIFTAVKAAAYFRDSHAYVGFLWTIPAITGGILVNALPSSNKIGLLFSYWTSLWFLAMLPVALAWMNTVTAGHTKRITTNAIVLSAYSIANAAGPFMWQERYKPRNHVPWTVIVVTEFAAAVLFMILRIYLAYENKRREKAQSVTKYEDVYVVRVVDGSRTRQKIDKAFLDLTDRENPDFRYVL